jgi:oligopeptide/dipeptide ABC transporter ATP-binding protein
MEVIPNSSFSQSPLHPYSIALHSAQLPQATGGPRPRTFLLRGDPPSAIVRSAGCRFASRCPLADAQCRAEEPPLIEYSLGRFVACYHAGDLTLPDHISETEIDAQA